MHAKVLSIARFHAIRHLVTRWRVPPQVAEAALAELASDLGLDVDDLAGLVVDSGPPEPDAEVQPAPGLFLVSDLPGDTQPHWTLGPPRHRRASTGWTVTRLRRVDAPAVSENAPPALKAAWGKSPA